jgi:hypothetical protein
MPALGSCKFVKLDVEGWEVRVIEGMAESVASVRPVLFLECNGPALASAGTSLGELLHLVGCMGYARAVCFDDHGVFVCAGPLSEGGPVMDAISYPLRSRLFSGYMDVLFVLPEDEDLAVSVSDAARRRP